MAAAAVLALRIGNTRQAAPLIMVNAEPAPGPEPADGLVTVDDPGPRRLYHK